MMDLRSYLRYLKSEKRYSAHTIKAYQTDLNQFSDFLSKTFELSDPLQAHHSHLRSWMVSLMEDEAGPRTVNRKLSALKSFYKFELKRGIIKSSPASKLIAPKISKRLPVFINEHQMGQMLREDLPSNDFAELRNRLMFELFYETGIRSAELVSLGDNSFDLASKSMRVLGKGNKERIIPISPVMIKMIREYRQQRNKMFGVTSSFLVTDSGKKIYPRFVYRVVNKRLQEFSTTEKKSPHVLRHTFATHMLNNGAEINAIKELLGHASLAATQVYTHNTIEKLKNVYKKAHPKA